MRSLLFRFGWGKDKTVAAFDNRKVPSRRWEAGEWRDKRRFQVSGFRFQERCREV
jgi:hypothetical protein